MASETRDTWEGLIRQSLEGDQQAFKAIYDKLSPMLYTVALRYMKTPSNAQDALQDSFVRIYQKLDSFNFKGAFEGWCRRVVVNTSIEHLRRSKSDFTESIDFAEQTPVSSNSLNKLELKEVMACIAQMPDGYRTVFNMYVIEGYSHKEIAEELGININTSKSQLFKARAYLQKLLQQQ